MNARSASGSATAEAEEANSGSRRTGERWQWPPARRTHRTCRACRSREDRSATRVHTTFGVPGVAPGTATGAVALPIFAPGSSDSCLFRATPSSLRATLKLVSIQLIDGDSQRRKLQGGLPLANGERRRAAVFQRTRDAIERGPELEHRLLLAARIVRD